MGFEQHSQALLIARLLDKSGANTNTAIDGAQPLSEWTAVKKLLLCGGRPSRPKTGVPTSPNDQDTARS
eukprot:1123998-Pyramimonas_sp.AAC.1